MELNRETLYRFCGGNIFQRNEVTTMVKDKWINIRCTEQERQDITEQAKANNMSVAEFFRYLVAKERKEKSNG